MSDQEEREQIRAFVNWFKIYGKYIIAVVLVVVGWIVYTNYQKTSQRNAAISATNAYNAIVIQLVEYSPLLEGATQTLTALKADIVSFKQQYQDSVYSAFLSLELAKILIAEDKYALAIDEFNWIIANSPLEALVYTARYRLAKVYYTQAAYDRALQLLQDSPPSYTIIYSKLLGDIHVKRQEYDVAIRYYDLAIKELPEGSRGILEIKRSKVQNLLENIQDTPPPLPN